MQKFFMLALPMLALTACNPQQLAEDTVRGVAQQNGFILDNGTPPIPEGLPVESVFEARYGNANCGVESYSEFRNRYVKAGRALRTFLRTGQDNEPGMRATLVRYVPTGPESLSWSPEFRNVFYVNDLEGPQGFGDYIIEVEAKGYGCRIESYQETKVS